MTTINHHDQVRKMLRALGFQIQYNGYRRLCIGIPYFASDPEQSLSKNLYPHIADTIGNTSACDVESSIRRSIVIAWNIGDRSTWEYFFPSAKKPPSNLTFIATLADYLQ